MKEVQIKIKSSHKGFLKHISTSCIFQKHWFLVVPHIRTLVISCQNIWLHTDLNHIYKEGGFLLNYINKVKYWRVITILITFGYQNCGKKTVFNAISMFSLSYFALQLLQKIMHHSFAYIFYHFTFFTIPEGDILLITNDDHDKYFSIASLV